MMSERTRNPTRVDYSYTNSAKMANELGPKKTMIVVVIVVGCFAVLWPKVFYPMLIGSANQHMKPSSVDKLTGCCDVIHETDINTIKIMSELCKNIIERHNSSGKQLSGKEIVHICKGEVIKTCGIDISAVLQEQVRLGQSVKQILDEVRSLNGSLCLKYNFGVSPWRLGVPHRINLKPLSANIKQERSPNVKAETIHPAFRERGSAIPHPQKQAASPSRPPPRIVEGRPGPLPGMRPTMGGPGHVVPPPKQSTTGSMGVIMPLYTIGIVIFFTYTLMKILFKKQPEGVGGSLYPPVEPNHHFRKEVFDSERSYAASRYSREGLSSKLVVNAMSALLDEVDQELEARRKTSDVLNQDQQHLVNGPLTNGNVKKEDHETSSVKVMGMEMRASCEGGKKWSRSNSPVLSSSPPPIKNEALVSSPQEIYLEGSLPPQSQILVADSATEAQKNNEDPAVVLAGKMTLSVISLDGENETNDSSDQIAADKMDDLQLDRNEVDLKKEIPTDSLPIKTVSELLPHTEFKHETHEILENVKPVIKKEIDDIIKDALQDLNKNEQLEMKTAIENIPTFEDDEDEELKILEINREKEESDSSRKSSKEIRFDDKIIERLGHKHKTEIDRPLTPFYDDEKQVSDNEIEDDKESSDEELSQEVPIGIKDEGEDIIQNEAVREISPVVLDRLNGESNVASIVKATDEQQQFSEEEITDNEDEEVEEIIEVEYDDDDDDEEAPEIKHQSTNNINHTGNENLAGD